MASTVNLGPIETTTVNSMVMGPRTAIAFGSSPCSLANACGVRIAVHLSLGTVTTIECSKDGVNFDGTGLLGGQFLLNPGDLCRVTYIVAPTGVFWPL